MFVERFVVNVTTDGSGNATEYSAAVTGRILSVRYDADGSVPFDNTADFTITAEATGETILTKTNVAAGFQAAPRQPTHGTDGTASLYAAGGAAVNDYISLAADRVKIAIAQGGAAKKGKFTILVG